jgi:hypothetical protein
VHSVPRTVDSCDRVPCASGSGVPSPTLYSRNRAIADGLVGETRRRPALLPAISRWSVDRRSTLVVCRAADDHGAVRSHRQALGRTRPPWYVAGLGSLALVAGCTSGPGPQRATVTHRIVVHGNAVLDGSPFDARWVGAVVLDGGLVTPCQEALEPVTKGHFTITVLADSESSGCGAPGARIVLWTAVHSGIVYSTNSLAWPRSGDSSTFAARYSTAAPAGAAPTTAEFSGGVFRRDGRQLPPGTRVEAYVGGARCGVASVRSTSSYPGYILAVVGPDSVSGCTRGATLTFRINGRPAADTSVANIPPGQQASLDLILR